MVTGEGAAALCKGAVASGPGYISYTVVPEATRSGSSDCWYSVLCMLVPAPLLSLGQAAVTAGVLCERAPVAAACTICILLSLCCHH
jgi:hypothetical protein